MFVLLLLLMHKILCDLKIRIYLIMLVGSFPIVSHNHLRFVFLSHPSLSVSPQITTHNDCFSRRCSTAYQSLLIPALPYLSYPLMSPERPCLRAATSKPYTRSPSPSTEDQNEFAQLEYPCTSQVDESQTGFPTRAQYQLIERGYLESLTPRRQGKALISQALFDRVWDVLHNADNVKENAQFRFWARKMFTLSKSHTVSFGTSGSQPMEQEVLLHDGLLVAVREQIYDLLCFCHGSTNHGGRDKTCALIRKHYTWVPKDLVAQFIKACPTCILKKCGHPEPSLLSPSLGTSAGSPSISAAQPSVDYFAPQQGPTMPLQPLREHLNEFDGIESHPRDSCSDSLPGTPLHGLQSQFIHTESSTPIDQLRCYNQLSSDQSSLAGFPMIREVSLYNGLPDGWQYQNVEYGSAYAECVEYQRMAPLLPYDPSLGRTRPRIPEIAPLFKADFEDYVNFQAHEVYEGSFSLSNAVMSPQAQDYRSQPISPTLEDDKNGQLPIDPLLVALSASMRNSVDYGSPNSREIPLSDILHTESELDMQTSSQIPSPGFGPVAIGSSLLGPSSKLEALDSVKTFREYISFRETLDSGSALLDQNINNSSRFWREGDDGSTSSSPAASIRSNVSGLSLVISTGTASPASMTSTPFTTAPITPADEIIPEFGLVQGGSKIIVEGECMEDGETSLELNAVIQAVSISDVEA